MHLYPSCLLPESGSTQLFMTDSYSPDSIFNYFHMEEEVYRLFQCLACPATAQGTSIILSSVYTMKTQPIISKSTDLGHLNVQGA